MISNVLAVIEYMEKDYFHMTWNIINMVAASGVATFYLFLIVSDVRRNDPL